ncbi:MAG: hypothetical protein V4505_15460 [Pseudomonadota bacterium]
MTKLQELHATPAAPAVPAGPVDQVVEYRGFAIHYHCDNGDNSGQAIGGVEPLTDAAYDAWGQLGGTREVSLSGTGEARHAQFIALAKLSIDEALDPPDA